MRRPAVWLAFRCSPWPRRRSRSVTSRRPSRSWRSTSPWTASRRSRGRANDGARPARARRLPPGRVVRARRRGADVRRAGRRRQGGVHARCCENGLYAAYTWRVRQFREGETNETTIRFTPEGRPYGFVERLAEDAPGAALDAGAARAIGEAARRAGASTWRRSPSPSRARSGASAAGSTIPSPTSAPAPPPAKGATACGWWCPATGSPR